MPNIRHSACVADWVERAKADAPTYRQRVAIEIVLTAISMSDPYADLFYLKGGILMGLAYGSPRLTADIDITANFEPKKETLEEIVADLEGNMPRAAAKLGYLGVVLRVISGRGLPKGRYPECSYPALKLTIGYAEVGSRGERALLEKGIGETIQVDISFREPTKLIEILDISESDSIHVYSMSEVISEKYRALIQQINRNRNRRQDVYDIWYIIENNEFDESLIRALHDSIILKCSSRGLTVDRGAMRNPEIKRRAGEDWSTLGLELDELPDFEMCFETVLALYESLPWD